MTDKPKNVVDVASLDLESKKEPIRVPAGGGFVTFPYPFSRPADVVEQFYHDVNVGMQEGKLSTLLKNWLPEKEREKFVKAYPNWDTQATIINAVVAKFQEASGTQGEDGASES